MVRTYCMQVPPNRGAMGVGCAAAGGDGTPRAHRPTPARRPTGAQAPTPESDSRHPTGCAQGYHSW